MLDNIYEREISDGLKDKLATASIAYCQEIKPTVSISNINIEIAQKTTGAVQPDLFEFESVLASCGWNKNNDVFDPLEMWQARATPEDKPLNLEHDQKRIVGHIIENRVVDIDMKSIANDTPDDKVPSKFHIITKAVIYKYWEDKVLAEEIKRIIAEIQEGQWYVSMECLFSGFDYGIIAPNGDQRIIARNEQTSFLTKHLRQYGGEGKYGDFTVGRIMRKIRFSGKGLVRKPANPDSIIFTPSQNFTGVFATLVYINDNDDFTKSSMEINQMNLEDQIKKLEATVVTLTQERDSARETLAHSSINSVKTQLDATKVTVAELETKLAKAAKDKDKDEDEKKELKKEKEKAEADKKEAEKKANDYEKEAKKFYEAKTKAERVAKVTAAIKSFDHKAAEEFVHNFAGLDDENFNAVLLLAASKFGDVDVTYPKPEPITPVEHKAKPENYVRDQISKYSKTTTVQQNVIQNPVSKAADILENVVVDDKTNVATAGTTVVDEVEATRASVADYMNDFLKNSKDSK